MRAILRSPGANCDKILLPGLAKKLRSRAHPGARKTLRGLLSCAFFLLPLLSFAQQPDTLKLTVPAPATGVQTDAGLGHSVAVDGAFTVVGVPEDDTGGQDSGVVKVFDSTTGSLLHILTSPLPSTGDQYGWSVAISASRVVVGAPQKDIGATNAGVVFVYDLSSGTPTTPAFVLNNPTPSLNDNFGWDVAISGTRLIVGAINDDTGATDTGNAYVYDLSSGTPTVPTVTLGNPAPNGNDSFGGSVGISGTRVVVGAANDDTGAADAGSAYVYNVSSGTPSTPIATLANPGPAANENFGASVSISGTRIVVGAARDDTSAADSGIAYVFDLGSGTPGTPIHTLNNPTPAAGDLFGTSVAVAGTRVTVGAPRDDSAGSDAGSAYVYDLSSGTPETPVSTLNNPSPSSNDDYGSAVAVTGTRVVVGAPGDDTLASDAGSAYGYDLSSGTPTVPIATFNNAGPSGNDNFGYSVAISGIRMVVGTPNDVTSGIKAGRVYVFDLASTTPAVPSVTLPHPNPAADDQFGIAVAISGTKVVVGAQLRDAGASNAGGAYVFDLASSTPATPIAVLDNPAPAINDNFGSAVAIAGNRVVVGAFLDDAGASDAGSAYVYDLSSGTPTIPIATLNNPAPASADLFGFAVGVSGTRVVIGAYNDDTGGTDTGSAYVYDLTSGTPTVPVTTLNNPTPVATDRFGISVAIAANRVVVGALNDDTGAIDTGSAYVYDLNSGTPSVPVFTLTNPAPASSDNFGYSVAISGTRVVVGALSDDTGAIDAGSAYVYDLSSGSPTSPVATLSNPSASPSDSFGISVAIDGASVVIGTPLDDTQVSDKGTAYFYRPSNNDTDGDGLLDLWEEANFGSLVAQNAGTDGDFDGRTALMELSFNSDPLAPNAVSGPPLAIEGGFLTLTVTKRAGVNYLGESSATPDAPSFSASNTTVLTNNATTLKVRDNFPINGGGKRFIRFKISSAP